MAKSRSGGWLRSEVGGLPMWGLLLGVLIIAAMGLWGISSVAARDAAPVSTHKPWTPPPADPDPVVVLYIGDSYSAGAGASDSSLRWTTVSSNELGIVEVNRALGGTGYVATSNEQGCGLEYCGTYAEVIAENADALTPDVVVISGGRNDGAPGDGYAEAVSATIQQAHAQWPDAVIIVTSPLWDATEPPEWLDDSRAIVQEVATANGATYLDLGEPLGGQPDLVGPDGIHPNDAGHAAIAAVFIQAWTGQGIATTTG